MKLTTKRKEQISSVLIICLGNILNAFSARVFLLPADLVAGGTTGIGLIKCLPQDDKEVNDVQSG